MEKRILFSVCGIGLGHFARMLPLAFRLQNDGCKVAFSTYSDAASISQKYGFETFTCPEIYWDEGRWGSFSPVKTILAGPLFAKRIVEQAFFEKRIFDRFRPNLIVADSRYSTLLAKNRARTPLAFITNQPYPFIPANSCFNAFLKPLMLSNNISLSAADVVIVPDNKPPYNISHIPSNQFSKLQSVSNDLKTGKGNLSSNTTMKGLNSIRFTGLIPASIVPMRIDENNPCIRNRLREKVQRTILKRMIAQDIKFAEKAEGKILIHISGPGSSKALSEWLQKYIKNRSKKYGDYLFVRHGTVIDILEFYKRARMVISRAGFSTISNLALTGVPSLSIPIINQWEQVHNATRFALLTGNAAVSENTLRNPHTDIIDVIETADEQCRENAIRRKAFAEMSAKSNGLENLTQIVKSMLP